MKVLICIPCLMTGGTEIQTLSLVNALVAANHQVTTVCYFEYSQNMVNHYEQAGSKVLLLSQKGERPTGIKNTFVLLFKGLRLVLKSEKPDVAHVQYMAPGAIPIVILRLLGVKRIVATAHTSADIYPSLTLLHFVSRYILTAFLCITKRAEESFFGDSRLYEPELRLARRGNHFTIHNTLPSYITIIRETKPFNNSITIGVISRLEAIKGMDLVVPAFAKVHQKHPDSKLLIVGDGSQRALMEQQVSNAGLDDIVEFAGRQPQEALQGYYDRIDILLMPSRSEGFGLTAIEGMARGCVVLASNVGGLPEVVRDGEVGLLHESENIRDIFEKLSSLIANPNKREQMRQKAFTQVQRFSTIHFNKLILSLYSKL